MKSNKTTSNKQTSYKSKQASYQRHTLFLVSHQQVEATVLTSEPMWTRLANKGSDWLGGRRGGFESCLECSDWLRRGEGGV